MRRQHPLRAFAITAAICLIFTALLGKMVQHGWLYYFFLGLGGSILLGIVIFAVRKLPVAQLQALLETSFVRRLGLTLVLLAVYFLALYFGYPVLKEQLTSALGLDETGVKLLVVFVPLLVATVFSFFYPAWEFAPGKIFAGATVVSVVLLILFLVTQWSEVSKKAPPPGPLAAVPKDFEVLGENTIRLFPGRNHSIYLAADKSETFTIEFPDGGAWLRGGRGCVRKDNGQEQCWDMDRYIQQNGGREICYPASDSRRLTFLPGSNFRVKAGSPGAWTCPA